MARYGNRKSPSGPKVSEQLPFYGGAPDLGGGTFFAGVGETSFSTTEVDAQYRVPAPGTLDTLLVQNNPIGANPTVVTYQARKNGANVGSPVLIANNAAGPVRVSLGAIAVNEGDLVSVSVTFAAFIGAPPFARFLFSWTPNGSA